MTKTPHEHDFTKEVRFSEEIKGAHEFSNVSGRMYESRKPGKFYGRRCECGKVQVYDYSKE